MALATLLLTGAARAAEFFDDFTAADMTALQQRGWRLRDRAGHPGPPGAQWQPAQLQLVDDAQGPGNRLLRLQAHTDGRAAGTVQSQLCHARKLLRGTYAARVRFSDQPVRGADGDPVVQAFYAIGLLRHDFDPLFSEIDFEYLANGGWGSAQTRLYGISWQTVQIEPWQAFNQAHERAGSHAGWHVLTMQVDETRTRHYVDGRLLAEHGGRNVPAEPMAISFSLWFSPAGLLPAGGEPRAYTMDVDWVLHVAGRQRSPQQMQARVKQLRAAGTAWHDDVAVPPDTAPGGCDL
jgi:hypothetical protein